MRRQLLKLIKKKSTKAERRFAERLKANHIPFRVKVKIKGREIDFICGKYAKKYAIEINGHEQDTEKNEMLVREGFIPIHISNNTVNIVDISYLKIS